MSIESIYGDISLFSGFSLGQNKEENSVEIVSTSCSETGVIDDRNINLNQESLRTENNTASKNNLFIL